MSQVVCLHNYIMINIGRLRDSELEICDYNRLWPWGTGEGREWVVLTSRDDYKKDECLV